MASFTETLEAKGVKFQRGSRPGEITLCCVFCEDRGETADERFRLGININSSYGQCFNCGWASRGHAKAAILRKLGEFDADDGSDKEEAPPPPPVDIPEGFRLLSQPSAGDKTVSTARRYLLERGVTKEQIRRYYIGATSTGRYAGRVIFPVIYRRQLRGLVARDLTGEARARYLNSKGTKWLYGLPHRKEGTPRVIVSEGIFKSLAIERAIAGWVSVNLLGHSVTEVQLGQMREEGVRKAVLWTDPLRKSSGEEDRAGIQGMVGVAEALQDAGMEVSVIWPPAPMQADEISRKEVKAFFRQNREPFTFALAMRMKLLQP